MRSGLVCVWLVAAVLSAGQPVRVNVSAAPGLSIGDFRLTDDGVPQQLTAAVHSTSGHVAVFVNLPSGPRAVRILRALKDIPQGVRTTVVLWRAGALSVLDSAQCDLPREISQLAANPDRPAKTEVADRKNVAEQMARWVAGADGWRSIVWISAECQFGSVSWTTARPVGDGVPPRGAFATVNQAGIAVYPVDLSGEAKREWTPSEDRPVPGADRQEWSGDPRPNPFQEQTRPVTSAAYLAAITGGADFRGLRGISGALRQAARDSRSSYTLVFQSTRQALPGKLHRLRVTAKGALRYRKAYFD